MNKNIKKKLRTLAAGVVLIFTINALPVVTYGANESSKSETKKVTDVKYLNSLSYEELINVIKGSELYDLRILFEFNSDTVEFYKDKNRVDALLNALEVEGAKEYKDKNNSIPNIIEAIRAGFNIGNRHNELAYFRTREYKSKVYKPIKVILNNESFNLKTKSSSEVVEAVGKFIGSTSSDGEIVTSSAKVLNEYRGNIQNYSKDGVEGRAVYNLISGISNSAEYDYQVNDRDATKTILYGNMDSFMNELEAFCNVGKDNLNENNKWIINNALYFTGRLSKFRKDKNISLKALTEAKARYDSKSYQYIEASEAIARNFNGKDYYGEVVNIDKIKKDAENKYLSKTYKFDNGKFIVKAGDKVSEEKIKRLYWAASEVKAQFMRVIQNDKPLENGNADDILTVAIYNSPEEYKMNEKINGISVDNGGIYIEPSGTFYTYERTIEDSIYTLEELFRHEYTHYLQGRYLVNGMWGKGDFYKNNLLTWYEEGTAEFFAGSTRTEGIKPRDAIISNLSYGVNNKMDVNTLLHANYGGWDFYNYGSAFADYMYNYNPSMFNKMSDLIKSNDANGYKKYIAEISKNSDINNDYEKNIDKLVKNIDKIGTPLVSDDYTKNHHYKDPNEMYRDISTEFKLNSVKTEVLNSNYFKTFELSGEYKIKSAGDKNKNISKINNDLNNSLKELAKKEWSGYKTLTAYFTDYKEVNDGNISCKVVVHGILNDDVNDREKANIKPNAKIDSSDFAYINEDILFDASKSEDKDGKIVQYKWDFGDGETSNKMNNKHKFKKAGSYTVKLTVTDDRGDINTLTKVVNITEKKDKTFINEKEKNDSFATANKIPSKDVAIKATMDNKDKTDMFSFEVVEDGEVSVSIDNPMLADISWIVYKEGKSDNYVMAPDRMDNVIEGKTKLSKGKYYINVYRFSENSKIEYSVYVNGAIKGSENKDLVEDKEKVDNTDKVVSNEFAEVESNDTYETANKIGSSKLIKGSFKDSDGTDIYEIDLDKASDFKISLNNKENIGLNWLLFKSSDLNNFVDYAKRNGENLESSYNAEKGKYYLYVYKYDESKGNYTINIG